MVCLLLGGGLVFETFLATWSNHHILQSVQESINKDLLSLPADQKKAYADEVQAYFKAHPTAADASGRSAKDRASADWQLP